VFVWAATLVLNAVPKFSVNVRTLTAVLVCVEHWLRVLELLALALRPALTYPTIGAEFEIESDVAPEIAMFA
jgi:hypothetical protein